MPNSTLHPWNPFTRPAHFRRLLLECDLVRSEPRRYAAKSFMCVFFTRFCGVGCPFCFFKSPPAPGKIRVEDQFNEAGIDRFISFCNQANLGYVLVSGGGEPLTQRRAVLRTIAEVKVHRIVLVTSGSWAMDKGAAKAYLQAMEHAWRSRDEPCKVTVRISVSEGHGIKLGVRPARNLIELFQADYAAHSFIKLQLHGFEGDPVFAQVLEGFPGHHLDKASRASDDEHVIKVIPQKVVVTLPSGYQFIAGISKVFASDLRPDLTRPEALAEGIRTFERDLSESEDFNSAVLTNTDGQLGLDWSLNYNGNICLWQNQVNDNQWNIYEDDYAGVLKENFRDPITLSYIEKGCLYRERIVAEVSPRTVLRYKAIGLRDYSGTILFEEEKIRLYYAFRVLQDYHRECRIDPGELGRLPATLRDLVTAPSPDGLQALFKAADHTIVDQYRNRLFDSVAWRDLLELVKLAHYDLSPGQVQDSLDYYNARTDLRKYGSIHEVEHEQGDAVQMRLADRLMYMKPSARAKFSPGPPATTILPVARRRGAEGTFSE